jgi:hypothetical protein
MHCVLEPMHLLWQLVNRYDMCRNLVGAGTGEKPDRRAEAMPIHGNPLLARSIHHEYADMRRVCHLYAFVAQEPPVGLLEYIFVDPPTIH